LLLKLLIAKRGYLVVVESIRPCAYYCVTNQIALSSYSPYHRSV